MEEDPLESIGRECKITYSQDEKLKKCRFALEPEENEEEDSSPQVTGIVMLSLPESNEDSLETDVFHTPPEQQQSQSMSGSEDQGPVKTEVIVGNDVGGFMQGDNAVGLGKDSVALGFSELNEIDAGNCVMDSDSDSLVFTEQNVVDSVKDVVCEPDLSKSNMERTVDLGKDSDSVVFSELNFIKKIDGVKDVVSDCDLSKCNTERTVDLGKDSDSVVFSELNVIKRIDGVKDVVSDRDLSKSIMERTVDLGKDSDCLVFSELNAIKRIDGVKDVVSDSDLSKVECDLKGSKVLESECEQSVMNECNVSAENVEYTEPIVIVSENVEIEETEVVNMVVEESCEEMGVRACESTKNVEERVEGENSGGHLAGKRKPMEDYDAFESASGGGVDEHGRKKGVLVRRELPNSCEPEEKEGLSAPQQAWNDVITIMELLEAPESTTDTDFLKAAMERGLTFPRPRWLPPEGFDDQVTDDI
ncbi:hypothetical protein POM88_049719 [Heracleum sosnowskyi]|uniref:Uncharacterized protein n=1 Tax=Heracleum sosnowskyi TaxID=360622 RepID=A0AAD8M1Y3_9APIA|nr:hypothetical protein POM88_049719 [Heracleum sosnowskyi]